MRRTLKSIDRKHPEMTIQLDRGAGSLTVRGVKIIYWRIYNPPNETKVAFALKQPTGAVRETEDFVMEFKSLPKPLRFQRFRSVDMVVVPIGGKNKLTIRFRIKNAAVSKIKLKQRLQNQRAAEAAEIN